LTEITSLSVLREIVEIDRAHVTVYPDESKHPPPGNGLNMPAEVTLEKQYPPSNVELEKFTNDLRSKPNIEFVSYDPKTGIWQFAVEHFSTVFSGSYASYEPYTISSRRPSVVSVASSSSSSSPDPEVSPATEDPLAKARAARNTKAKRKKIQRERTARAVFNKIIEVWKTERVHPSDEERRHLNSFLDVIDVDKFLAWYNESGARGVSYTYNNGIIFDQMPGELHERVKGTFDIYFNAMVNQSWGICNGPFHADGSRSIFLFKLN